MYLNNVDSQTATQLEKHKLNSPNELIVICLCAQWCGTCREYQEVHEDLSAKHPSLMFIWIDIEITTDISEVYDVENFPSIALFTAQGEPYFLGTILPHKQHLERLIQTTKAQITQQQQSRLAKNDASIAQTIYRILTATK